MPRYCPRLEPAGENHAALFMSVAAIRPAVEEAAGICMNWSLNLSYTFRKLPSLNKYDDLVNVSAVATTLVTMSDADVKPTTSSLAGDATTTQSFLSD